MIKVWKSFLFPNSLEVHNKNKSDEELEVWSKKLMLEIEQFSFNFKGKSMLKLPRFHAPNLKEFILEGNMIQDMSEFAQTSHLNLKKFRVINHKELSKVYLVQAPNLQTIYIKKNLFSDLLNVEKFQSYTELKIVDIEGMNFRSEFKEQQLVIISSQKTNFFQENYKISSYIIQGKNQIDNHNLELQIKQLDFKFQPSENKTNKQNLDHHYKFSLSNNIIQFLPCFSSKHINQLQCARNSLESIQWFSKGFYPYLHTIDLSFNKIKKLPKLNVPSAKIIKATSNQIRNVTEFFSNIYPNLMELNLADNQILQIKQINCPQLEKLVLEKNKIQILPILNTPKLKVLLMKYNLLAECDFSSSSSEIKLQYLDLDENQLQKLPILNPINLNHLSLVSNSIQGYEYFVSVQFPQLQTLRIMSQKRIGDLSIYKNTKLPQLKMPLLETLNLELTLIADLRDFLNESYQHLIYLDLGMTQTLIKLPKLKMPSIKRIMCSRTSINDITEFVQGNYPSLVELDLPKRIIILQGPKQYNHLQQLKSNSSNSYELIPLKISPDNKYLKHFERKNILTLQVDLSLVKSTQFLTFMNFSCTKIIEFENVYEKQSLMKNLSKINFSDVPNLEVIEIRDRQIKTNISFTYRGKWMISKSQNVKIEIGVDNQWRRAFRPEKNISWRIYSIDIFGQTQFVKFQSRLTGKRIKSTRQFCKKMNYQNSRKSYFAPRMEQAYK